MRLRHVCVYGFRMVAVAAMAACRRLTTTSPGLKAPQRRHRPPRAGPHK